MHNNMRNLGGYNTWDPLTIPESIINIQMANEQSTDIKEEMASHWQRLMEWQ